MEIKVGNNEFLKIVEAEMKMPLNTSKAESWCPDEIPVEVQTKYLL